MYYDDPFDPNLENDYDDPPLNDDILSITSGSVGTDNGKKINPLDIYNTGDKGHRRIIRKINRKRTSIDVYSTDMVPGGKIRNAISGARSSNMKVGRSDESLFFKVKISTGEHGIIKEDTTLYFDSPEQYERHMGATVTQPQKDTWLNANLEELSLRKP